MLVRFDFLLALGVQIRYRGMPFRFLQDIFRGELHLICFLEIFFDGGYRKLGLQWLVRLARSFLQTRVATLGLDFRFLFPLSGRLVLQRGAQERPNFNDFLL